MTLCRSRQAFAAGLAGLTTLLLLTMTGTSHADWKQAPGPLTTRWDRSVSPTNALPEYPRPMMARARWQSLNGLWDYALTDSVATALPAAFDAGQILVPYPYEASLSGVGRPSPTDQRLWYRRTFTVPASWRTDGQRVLLHFGAVNWDSTVSVNGTNVGDHKGGYDGFDYDITPELKSGTNTLIVSAWNPLTVNSADAQVVGKQRAQPANIFYTGATGIWQTVWLEPTPAAHIASLNIVPDIDAKVLRLTVNTVGSASRVRVTATDGTETVATMTGRPGAEMSLPLPDPHLWSPDDPHLYGLHVALAGPGGDAADSYFAMRKVSLGKDAQGRPTVCLNNRPIFQVGALDQGYWPDGIYTAPTDDALKSDIVMAKKFGFNLLRKHAKVEPERWYYWADRLGMLVWQDMPQCFAGQDGSLTDGAKAQWLAEWKHEIATHANHPSIIVWTTFNEGWGEHDVADIVALTKRLDPTRLVNDASGWTDMNVGDIRDTHAYPGPWSEEAGSVAAGPGRAVANGEFGGLTMRVPDHMWTTGVFGYGTTLSSGWNVTQQYQDLLKNAYGLRDSRGTCAFVYTQLTDVEDESNGLMTYDRAIVKPLASFIAAANHGQFPTLPPKPTDPSVLVPTSQDDPQTWSYTDVAPAADWYATGFDASAWKTGPAPFGQGYPANTPWTDTPGDIWLRRTVTLPATIPAKLVVRTIHDEDVEVYVNGVLAASAPGYVGSYVDLPMSDAARAALHPGANVLAVHCHQTVGGQVIDVGIVSAQ